MNIKKGQKVLVKIEKIAFGGAGIGTIFENYRVFVEDTIPGDLVEASFTKIKKNYAEARFEKFVKKSDLRITPRCEYFERCGGCKLQYLSYEDQLKFKQQHVEESLLHIGNFKDLNILPIIGCRDTWFYRNKMEFSFGDTFDRNYALGLHAKGKRYDLINNEKCYLQSELSSKILNSCREFFIQKKLPVYNFKDNSGILRNLVIKEGKYSSEIMVNLIISGEFFSEDIKEEFVDLVRNIDHKICSICLTQIISKKGERRGVNEQVLLGKGFINERMQIQSPKSPLSRGLKKAHLIKGGRGDLLFKISSKSFFQPNTSQAQVLYEKVLEFADLKSNEVIFDMYCGTGTIGIIFSKFVKKVYGFEIVEDAVKDAKENAALNNCKNIEFLCGDVKDTLKKVSQFPDLIVLDPPRSGLSPKALENILKISTEKKEKINNSVLSSQFLKLLYISCNPTTQARDLKIFCENGFQLIKCQPVDMFPHTYHIENIALLVKNNV